MSKNKISVKRLIQNPFREKDLFDNMIKKDIALINLSSLEAFHESKVLNLKNPIDLKVLKEKKIINKKFLKLKILGSGELKTKIDITAHFASKQAQEKITKAGGKLNIIKK